MGAAFRGEDQRILVTGGSGQVGGALVGELALMGAVYAPGRSELDLASAASIRAVVREFRPGWIVNAGAYTAVDKAEEEEDAAFAVNGTAVEVLAEAAKRASAAVLHFSTDYVFDGRKPAPYLETDATQPLRVYGESKRAGELALEASGVPYMIFRTSWVYGATGKNFLRTILRAAGEREVLRVVADQRGAPTWSSDLARMVARVMAGRMREATELGVSVRESLAAVQGAHLNDDEAVVKMGHPGLGGTYHATSAGETTWFGFAEEALRLARIAEPERKLARLEAIPTASYPTPARRPMNSRLDCGKLSEVLGWRMPEWRASLAEVMRALAASGR